MDTFIANLTRRLDFVSLYMKILFFQETDHNSTLPSFSGTTSSGDIDALSTENLNSDDSDSESEDEDEKSNETLKKELIDCTSNLRESVFRSDFPSMLTSLKNFDNRFLKRAK